MRLLKIGRDASCDIVLHSGKVSSLHAELTLLNNGDITIEDKNSSNGTFIMNQPIKPGKPVKVRRGDAIRFADCELQWSQVPMPEDNTAYKGIYGIGSHFNNDLQISGSTVSRYHATVKLGKDGKMYIFDHSKNGTTVNGTKISQNTAVRIKKGDAVVCGGVPVDLSTLPWPSSVLKYVVAIAASLLLLVGIGFGANKLMQTKSKIYNDSELYSMYNNSVVLLVGKYHYEVEAGSLPKNVLAAAGIPAKFKVHEHCIIPESSPIYPYIMSQATGFFVSEDGEIVTNLHVVSPWLFNDEVNELEELCKAKFAKFAAENDIRSTVYTGNATILSAYTSQIKVKGVRDALLLVPQGKILSAENAESCRVLSAGDDPEIDVALVQTEKGELPHKTRYINVTDSIDVSDAPLKVGLHMYTLGFPLFNIVQDMKMDKGIQITACGGSITRADNEYGFGFDATSYHGASGSPIFNDKGMLIGVLNKGFDQAQGFNFGIKAKYVKELLNSPHKVK